MFKTFPIVLDVTKHQLNDMFQVNSNDLNTVRLNLSIKSGLDIFDLTGKIVRIAIKKPDGFIAFQTGGVTDPSNGLCEFILDRQAYLVEGKHEAEVMIYQDDSTVIVTERFYYKVNRAIVNDKTLISTNHLPAINQAIIAGEQLKDIDIPEFVEAANSAYETIEEAETQGLYAKGQGDYAKQEADRAAARVTELNGVDAVQFKDRQDQFDVQLAEKATYVDSVATLKSTTKFKDNDIVITLGYYTTDDGGGSAFLIKSTSLTSDDGSIITLSNGKQAHLIPTEFVNYRQFGAKLDGDITRVSAETTAIKNCHIYANAKNLPVIQNGGTVILNNTVTVQTDTDISGCNILIKSYAAGKTLYSITSKKTAVPVTSFIQSELKMGATQIPSLNQYKHHMITIVSDQLLSERNDGGSVTPMYRKDSFFLTRDGAMVSGKLIQDFTTGTLTVTARPYEERKLTFKGPKIIWDFQNLTSSCVVVDLKRGNAELGDMFLDIPNAIDYDDALGSGFKGQAFNIQDAYKVKLSNILSENITEGITKSGYIVNMSNVIDVTFDRVTWLNGWGATGTNNVKDWKVFDSQINRIDAHTGTGDLYCRNVRFIGGWGVFLGYGDGTVTLENCTSDLLDIDGRDLDCAVYIGVSYGVLFKGDIEIINHKVISRSGTAKSLVSLTFSGTGIDYKSAYDLKLPNLKVRDLHFEGTGNEKLYGYMMQGLDTMQTTLVNNDKYLILPSVIDIDGVTLNIDNNNSYFHAINMTITSAIVAGRTKAINPKVRLKNIHQTIDSKFKNGFTTAELTADPKPKKIIYMFAPKEAAPTVEYDFLIDNCGGGIQIEVNSNIIKVIDSETTIDAEGVVENSPNRLIVRNCEWYLFAANALTTCIIQNTNLDGSDNIIYLCKKDGVALPPVEFNYAGGAKKLRGNVFVDQSVSTTIADKYWSYLDATIYKAPNTVFKSPDGSSYKITIGNDGALTTTKL